VTPIETRARIAPEHPALAGHFPGDPIVPGAVLLDEILNAARQAVGAAAGPVQIPWVKFHAPLRPGEEFVIRIEKQKFTVRRGETLIASGNFKFE
jgi:3-hydroxymyristoyl/3-hydroxydecanoyl-(acyl carrier protein) dehydratase